jgi:hypothetical protein
MNGSGAVLGGGMTTESCSAMTAHTSGRWRVVRPSTTENGQGVEVFEVLQQPTWQSALAEKISGFRTLPQNWNSYGSQPPTEVAIRHAIYLLSILDHDCPRPRVLPVSGGGIQFEWDCNDRELELEILHDGSIEVLVADTESVGEEETFDSLDRMNVEKLLSWLTNNET